ncbi:MAG: hypothetical protein U5K84_11040 [Alkalibacterium sp.]|nr:hypothetical protein [Alkalibacterium sp.]
MKRHAQLKVKEKEANVEREKEKLDRIVSESRKLKSEQLFHSSIDHLKTAAAYTRI